jgi:hypothetical protein
LCLSLVVVTISNSKIFRFAHFIYSDFPSILSFCRCSKFHWQIFFSSQENATSSSNNSSGIGKSIVYGCTELISPTDFLSQLTSLGREITQPLSSKK